MMSESLSLLLVLSILVKIVGFYWAFSFWVFFFFGSLFGFMGKRKKVKIKFWKWN